jgi:hypothetical protein
LPLLIGQRRHVLDLSGCLRLIAGLVGGLVQGSLLERIMYNADGW